MSDRPHRLDNTTYKLRSPHFTEAVYVTISDEEIDGEKRPVEIFLNSKDMKNYQWVSCMTRLVSRQLRYAPKFPVFVVEELCETFDPSQGGYYIPGTGEWVNSFIAHIGWTLKLHSTTLGLMGDETSRTG